MTLTDYKNTNSHCRVRKAYILLAPRNKFDGSGGLEALGIYTDIAYAAANAFGVGVNGTNVGTGVSHVDINMIPDPPLGRNNRYHFPPLFESGKRVAGTYLDEARRERFGVIPEIPPLLWSDVKVQRFNNLNQHFGGKYEELVRQRENEERAYYNQMFAQRPITNEKAYVVFYTTPSTAFPPSTVDIAAIFYGEDNSREEAVAKAHEFRIQNPTAPRLIVAELPVNTTIDHFMHDVYTARTMPEASLYSDNEKAAVISEREYRNMLEEVTKPRIRTT